MHRDPIQPIRASGPSRSPRARGRDLLRAAMVASAVIALGAPTARAEGRLQKLRGHLGIGYAKLLGSETPARCGKSVGQNGAQPGEPFGLCLSAKLRQVLVSLQQRLLHDIGSIELGLQARTQL